MLFLFLFCRRFFDLFKVFFSTFSYQYAQGLCRDDCEVIPFPGGLFLRLFFPLKELKRSEKNRETETERKTTENETEQKQPKIKQQKQPKMKQRNSIDFKKNCIHRLFIIRKYLYYKEVPGRQRSIKSLPGTMNPLPTRF